MISFGAVGAAAYSATNGTSVAPAYPTGITAGQMLVLVIGMKPSTANSGSVTTPAGWTSAASHTAQGGYATTLGVDTGNTSLYIYTKVAAGSESGTLTVTVATNSVCWAYIARYTTTSTGWDTSIYATGAQATEPATSLSATTGSLAIQAGDLLIYAWSFATDNAISWADPPSITAPGSYIRSATALIAPISANGNDIGGNSGYALVSNGAVPGAVTWTRYATVSLTGCRGPLIVMALRESPVAIPAAVNRAYAVESLLADTAVPVPNQLVRAVEALGVDTALPVPVQRAYAVEMLVVEGVLPAPLNDVWIWDGAVEVPAHTTVWNGTAEIPSSVEVV